MKKHLFVILVATVCLWSGAAPLVVGIADMCSTTNAVNVQSTYVAAVAAAGNTPLVLPAETARELVARMLVPLDALLLCGGEDVEPRRYGAKPSPRRLRVWGRSTCAATPGSSCFSTRR